MTTGNICRRVLDSALPGGPVWTIKPGGTLDKFFNGTAQNFEDMRELAAAVADLRDPEKTGALDDLEIEFGVTPDESLSTAERRVYLAALMGERTILPSHVVLEEKLRAAGFDVRVYPNDPPLDPDPVITAANGYYLANGNVLDYQERDYTSTVCDDASDDGEVTVCDDDGTEDVTDRGDTVAAFESMLRYPYEYSSPTRYRWPLIFWIAAGKTGGETFVDWHMERATVTAWDAGGDASLSKSLEWKASGIRSLEVLATAGWSDPIGPHAEQMLEDAITTARTVTVEASASDGVYAGLSVCDKDGVWSYPDFSAVGSDGETLTRVASNGVSGARLYVAGEQLCPDGDMEATGVVRWPGTDATTSKSTGAPHSGSKCLKITADAASGTKYPLATNAGVMTVGKTYAIIGAAASDGTHTPVIFDGVSAIWTGTTSTDWQEFSVIHTAANGAIIPYFQVVNPVGTECIYIDDIMVFNLTDGVPVVGDFARFDLLEMNDPTFSVASISETWREKFEKLVLRYKPLRTWAGMLINWTTSTPKPGPFGEDDA